MVQYGRIYPVWDLAACELAVDPDFTGLFAALNSPGMAQFQIKAVHQVTVQNYPSGIQKHSKNKIIRINVPFRPKCLQGLDQ